MLYLKTLRDEDLGLEKSRRGNTSPLEKWEKNKGSFGIISYMSCILSVMPAHIITQSYGIEFGLGFVGHGSARGFTSSAALKSTNDHVDVMDRLDQL